MLPNPLSDAPKPAFRYSQNRTDIDIPWQPALGEPAGPPIPSGFVTADKPTIAKLLPAPGEPPIQFEYPPQPGAALVGPL